ncbi:MAG: Gfo/Idh/MocA family oxidoreductase [Nocardiopsaceae bacterium]|nr:Gfo/Idh/MocA family oxidoreductase [Nocardiopsaceae bacterium]
MADADIAGGGKADRGEASGDEGVGSVDPGDGSGEGGAGRVLRVGILGAARIAESALVVPARAISSVTVGAIATRRDKGRAESFALRHGIPVAYGSYQELLADPSVDAVYIPLPNALHGSWTLRALAAGKHVLCEKPFAVSAAEAERVASAAAASGLVVMEAMHYRYHPLVRRMASAIADGVIGTPRHVQCWTSWPVPDMSDIRYSFELGGGALMDGGCYAIDCLRLLGLSDPVVTGALADPLADDERVDRAMAVRLSSSGSGPAGSGPAGSGPAGSGPAGAPRQPGQSGQSGQSGLTGLTGWLESEFTRAGEFRAEVHVTGDDGHLRLRNFINAQDGTLTVSPDGSSWHRSEGHDGPRTPGEPSRERPVGDPDDTTFAWQLRAFAGAVADGEPFPTTPASAAVTMRVIDDAYRAAGLPVREPVSD